MGIGNPTLREYLSVLERYGSYMGRKIDEGKLFKVYRRVQVNPNGSYNLYIDNSTSDSDVIISILIIEADGKASINVYKDVNINSYGSEVTPEPFVIGDELTIATKFYENVDYSGGVLIDGGQIQSTRGRRGIGGDQEFNVFFKIRAGKSLLIEVENLDSVSIRVDVKLIAHEG